MALIDIYGNAPRSLIREGLMGYDQGMQANDARRQREAQAQQQKQQEQERIRQQSFQQNLNGLLGSYGEYAHTPEGQRGLFADMSKAGFGREMMGLMGGLPEVPKPPAPDPGEWRNVPGSGTLFNNRSGATKETGVVPYQKSPAAPAQPGQPKPLDLARERFNEQKRVNDARIAAMNRPKPPPAAKAPAAPKGMSGDAAKLKGLVETLPGEANQLKTMIQQMGPRGFVLKFKAGDPSIGRIVDQVADKVGRLRSGGAVNKDEETRFKAQVARWSDVAYGDDKAMLAALDGIINEAMITGKAMLPPAPAGDPNSDPLGIR
jgi:hypothetical protein